MEIGVEHKNSKIDKSCLNDWSYWKIESNVEIMTERPLGLPAPLQSQMTLCRLDKTLNNERIAKVDVGEVNSVTERCRLEVGYWGWQYLLPRPQMKPWIWRFCGSTSFLLGSRKCDCKVYPCQPYVCVKMEKKPFVVSKCSLWELRKGALPNSFLFKVKNGHNECINLWVNAPAPIRKTS